MNVLAERPKGEMAERETTAFERRRAYAAAASVPDPEVPCVTVADLGFVLSDITVTDARARLAEVVDGPSELIGVEATDAVRCAMANAARASTSTSRDDATRSAAFQSRVARKLPGSSTMSATMATAKTTRIARSTVTRGLRVGVG